MSWLARILAEPAARWLARILAVVWMGAIFTLSSVPGGSLPGRYGQLAHLFEYAVLAALVYASVRRDPRDTRAVAMAVLFAAVYALTDEAHQFFVPGRTVDAADWGTDVIGALLGAMMLAVPDKEKAA